MNKEWSLKELYSSVNDEKFIRDEKRVDELIEEQNKFADSLSEPSKEKLIQAIKYDEELGLLLDSLYGYLSLRQSVNTSDNEAIGIMGRLSQKLSKTAKASTKFVEYVASFPNLEEVVAGDDFLKEYAFYLENTKKNKAHTLLPETEEALSLYRISGSGAWGDLQEYLTSTVPVEYEGKITTLSDIRNKAYDKDVNVRKSAYEAELKAYDRVKDAIAFSINSIKLEVINTCKLRKYDSPLAKTLEGNNMKRETLDALMKALEESLPKFWEYMNAKAKLLGYEGGLKWYDLFAPLEGNTKKFTTEEARDYLVDLFSGFDKEEADMIATAFNDSWIDFFPRDGKVGGAFCADVHELKQSRILTNFDGSLGDVVTLAHELGHGFHNWCMRDNSVLNLDVSMPVAETASTFNEVVCMNAAIARETDPVAKRALIESQLMDAAQIICDIYSRYLFETKVFENREANFMFADELCNIMTEAQKKAYGTGLDENCMHPYMWACKSHYYSTYSFYNFPYAFGGLFARGLYAKYLKDGKDFVPLYKKLLKATGSTSVEDAALIAGIDLTDINFWRDSLKILTDEIDEFIELCK